MSNNDQNLVFSTEHLADGAGTGLQGTGDRVGKNPEAGGKKMPNTKYSMRNARAAERFEKIPGAKC